MPTAFDETRLPSSASLHAPAGPLRFGPGGRFELRPAEYRLLVDGQPAPLGGRALDLLMALAARPAELHTKSQLLDIVWPGLVVEEGNLRVQINTLRRLLGEDAIATVPGRGYRLAVAVQAQAQAPLQTTPPPPLATAGPHPLFGRDTDLARLEDGLRSSSSVVTLVGTPGVGKSSLARLALARWPGRGAWVDLAPLTLASQLPGALARALGGQLGEGDTAAQQHQLLGLLQTGEMLLVLDNAEHLVEACAHWVLALQAAPRLHLLVTSQLPLALPGERVQRLEPLPEHEGATALLLNRIAAADSRFQVTPATQPLLGALCRQLDGLPLALEMAAARVPLMGLQAVHDALAERFALLARGRRDSPARHRTLLDALGWSYGLLGTAEQRLFSALGVFAGGFTLDLAVTLTADEHVGRWDVVDGLAALVERSLVVVDGGDPPRYRLLETMRAFALGKLALPGPQAADAGPSLRRRHAAALLALFAGGSPEALCLAEMENAREALLWARENDLALAAQLGARVTRIIGFTPWRQEVTDWMLSLQPAMQAAPGQALPLPTQAAWWAMLAYALVVRRSPAARPAARQAVQLCRQLGDAAELQAVLGHWVRAIAEPGAELDEAVAALQQSAAAGFVSPRAEQRVHGALAEAARVRGDYPALLACREQELRLAREQDWVDVAQAAETNVCAALLELGRLPEAAERGRALLRRMDAAAGRSDNGNLPWALYVLGEALERQGAFAEARALAPRSLAADQRFGTTVAWNWILALVLAQQHLASAGRLLGYIGRLWSTRKDSPDLGEQALWQRVEAAVLARFGAELAGALAAEGRGLDDAAAAALAVRSTDSDSDSDIAP